MSGDKSPSESVDEQFHMLGSGGETKTVGGMETSKQK